MFICIWKFLSGFICYNYCLFKTICPHYARWSDVLDVRKFLSFSETQYLGDGKNHLSIIYIHLTALGSGWKYQHCLPPSTIKMQEGSVIWSWCSSQWVILKCHQGSLHFLPQVDSAWSIIIGTCSRLVLQLLVYFYIELGITQNYNLPVTFCHLSSDTIDQLIYSFWNTFFFSFFNGVTDGREKRYLYSFCSLDTFSKQFYSYFLKHKFTISWTV